MFPRMAIQPSRRKWQPRNLETGDDRAWRVALLIPVRRQTRSTPLTPAAWRIWRAKQAEDQVIVQRSAQSHRRRGGTPSLLDYMGEQSSLLRDATQRFRETPEKEALSYAAEWMLDNFYLVQQTLRQIREDMPPGFYAQLPKLTAGPLEGYRASIAVALELVVLQAARLDLDRVKALSDSIKTSHP